MGRQTKAGLARRGGTRHWTAAEAKRELAAWKASGLPLATFARRRGLNGSRLAWWKTRLGDWCGNLSPARAPAFIPAVVRELVEAATPSATAPVTVRVPGGVAVEVADPASVSPAWLTAVVSGLSRDV